MEVKGFKNKELNEAFITTPQIVCNYISALKRAYDMSEETNQKALKKIRKLTKAIDDISNSERKTIVDLSEANKKLKAEMYSAMEGLKENGFEVYTRDYGNIDVVCLTRIEEAIQLLEEPIY